MHVSLISTDQRLATRHFVACEQATVVGRSSQADVHVEDRWVSRFHCDIREVDGTLVVRDLGSRHGTYVNVQRLQEAFLMPGDRLSLGVTTFCVQYRRQATGGSAGLGVSPTEREAPACCRSAERDNGPED
jgi:pSer/pThr/pTyr-binding forkhead associated (FHA) protein